MYRFLLPFLALACGPASDTWDTEPRPADYNPPPGTGGLTLTGPTEVAAGQVRTWTVSAPDLEVGVEVHMGWGGEIAPGRCPFRRLIGGWLCMDVANPIRHFGSTVVVPDPDAPGSGLAVFDITVPRTNRSQIHFQSLSVNRLESATSNVLTVDILRPDVPLCSITPVDCVDDSELVLWTRADGVAPDGTDVALWPDSSPAGNDASQSSPDAQPTYVANAIGDRGVMRFDGSDRLDVLSNVLSSTTDPYTLFVVFKADSLDGHLIGTGSSDAGFQRSFGNAARLDAGRVALKSNSSGSGLYLAGKGRANEDAHILSAVASTANGSKLYLDGVANGTAATALNAHGYTKSTIGASDGFNADNLRDAFTGDIAEIMVFQGELTDAEREDIESGLAGFYGLSLGADNRGCDGVVDSGATYDTCGVCEGDGTSCLVVDALAPSLWLRGDDLGTESSLVASWPDASVATNDAFQALGDLQPCFAPTGLAEHGAVYFDGVNDRLDLGTNTFGAGSDPKTVMVVIETNDTAGHIVGTGSSDPGFLDSYGTALTMSGGKPAMKANTASTGTYIGSGGSFGAGPHIVTMVLDASGSALYMDGGLAGASSATPNGNAYTRSTLGASDGAGNNSTQDPLAGWVAEVLVFDQALDAEDRIDIETYLGTRYDITRYREGTVLAQNLWLHADDLDGAPASTEIASWPDRTDRANDANQSSPSLRPTVQYVDGRAVARFDGSNDRLDLTTNIFGSSDYPMSVFAVVSTTSTNGHIVGHGSSSAGFLDSYGSGLMFSGGAAGAKANSASSGQYITSFDDVDDGALHVISYVADTTGADLFVDGGFQGGSASSPNPFGYSRASVGASDGSASNASRDPLDGDIVEIRVYGLPLDDAQRQAIEVEMATDHGVELSASNASIFQDLELFWRMDESGSSARVDVMQGLTIAPWPPDAVGTTPTPAKVGDGQLVDGPNGYHFWRADTPALDHGGSSFTWAGWMRLDSTYDSQTFVGKWEYAENHKEYRIWYDTSRSTWAFEVSADGLVGPASSVEVLHPAPLVLGEWAFIEAWHDAESDEVGFRIGNSSTMGSAVTTAWAAGVHDNHDDLNFAAHNQCADDHLDGGIDAIGYWSRVLTSDERDTLWNSGAGWEP